MQRSPWILFNKSAVDQKHKSEQVTVLKMKLIILITFQPKGYGLTLVNRFNHLLLEKNLFDFNRSYLFSN